MRPSRRTGSILSIMLLVCVVRTQADISTLNLIPPEKPLQSLKRIIVLDFVGKGGAALADYLRERWVEDRRVGIAGLKSPSLGGRGVSDSQGEPYTSLLRWMRTNPFAVVDRSQTETIARELKLQNTGLINPDQAREIGKLSGADAIAFGTIEVLNPGKTERSRIVGSTILSNEVSIRATLKIITVQEGEVVGTKVVNAAEGSSADRSMGETLKAVDELLDACLKSAAGQLVDYLAPHLEYASLDLRNIKVQEFKARASDARKAAEGGRPEDAFNGYASIARDDPYNPEVWFNLGAINEQVGNYARAESLYNHAASIVDEGDYRAASRRAGAKREQINLWRSWDMPYAERPLIGKGTSPDCPGRSQRVRGDSDQRQTVWSGPEKTAGTVARLPGGMTVCVLADSASWCRVRLVDGKIGWMLQEDLE